MGKFSLDKWTSAKPASKNKGEYFTGGRGVVIVKDVRVDKTDSDEHTYIFEGLVKSSATNGIGTVNAEGATVSFVQLLDDDKYGYHLRDSKSLNDAILGPDDGGDDAVAAAWVELMRLDDDGHSKKGTQCPARGVEVAYETFKKKNSDLVFVAFTHIPWDDGVIAANRAVLDGKK